MKQRVFILGAPGNIGRELVSQITEKDLPETHNHKNPTEIIGMANSKNFILETGGITTKILNLISSAKDKRSAGLELEKYGEKLNQLADLKNAISQMGLDGEVIFVDVTDGKEELREFHLDVISDDVAGNSLVTANKNPVSLYSMADFNELTKHNGRYDFNTTVMGGAGIVNFMQGREKIGDVVRKIEGCFSGTLGYILSELEKGEKTFSEIVRQAVAEGYAEPNPWDDLNGLDVARKLLILARIVGYEVSMDDVEIEPLIAAEKYAHLEGEEFLEAIKEEDEIFAQRVQKAAEKEKVLRYVARLGIKNGKLKMTVRLEECDKNSDLGGLQGTLNLALIETDLLCAPLPHIIKSRGAGVKVTAGAVRVGIANMLSGHLSRR